MNSRGAASLASRCVSSRQLKHGAYVKSTRQLERFCCCVAVMVSKGHHVLRPPSVSAALLPCSPGNLPHPQPSQCAVRQGPDLQARSSTAWRFPIHPLCPPSPQHRPDRRHPLCSRSSHLGLRLLQNRRPKRQAPVRPTHCSCSPPCLHQAPSPRSMHRRCGQNRGPAELHCAVSVVRVSVIYSRLFLIKSLRCKRYYAAHALWCTVLSVLTQAGLTARAGGRWNSRARGAVLCSACSLVSCTERADLLG